MRRELLEKNFNKKGREREEKTGIQYRHCWVKFGIKKKRKDGIGESKYNNTYKNIITKNLPKYLRTKKKRGYRSLQPDTECGNELKRHQH